MTLRDPIHRIDKKCSTERKKSKQIKLGEGDFNRHWGPIRGGAIKEGDLVQDAWVFRRHIADAMQTRYRSKSQ